jgi:hypothetical protein
VVIYRGLDNMRRIRIDQPPDLATEDPLATTDPATVPKN